MIATIIDFILHIDQHLVALTAQYGAWLYAILFWIVFCETGLVVTPFLPGDSLLFAAGAVAAASQGNLNVHAVVGVLLIAAILGDAVNFAIGKYFGAKLFANPNSKIFKQEYLHKTHAFYEKYGGKTIILARFVPIVRTFAPFVAGMGDMNYSKFIRYNIIGALAWVLSLTYLGYWFGNLPIVKDNFGKVVIGIIVVSVLPMIIEMVKAKMGKQNDTK
ncbi:DedA family protein [Kingella kingae]|uniref:DedA family protein n=1 Tax=Kingella kingae TaxID=504 RepID=UPI00041807DB|nr:DedA family protein [Kingella kingae]MDK4525340.1 DedA family protein [Kingella kingae]MDK4531365.1 DedA family protein [Kingella kingae]QIP51945.1 DedA family protein [Kingella kingae]